MTQKEIDQLRKNFEESEILKYYNEKGDSWASAVESRRLCYKTWRKTEQGKKFTKKITKIFSEWNSTPEAAAARKKAGLSASKYKAKWMREWLDSLTKEEAFELFSKAGRKGGNSNVKNKTGYWKQTHEELVEAGRKGGAESAKWWDKASPEEVAARKKRISDVHKGKPKTEEHKAKTPYGANFNSKKKTCEHCHASVTHGIYGKNHGNKCHIIKMQNLQQYVSDEWMPIKNLSEASNLSAGIVRKLTRDYPESKNYFEVDIRVIPGMQGRIMVVKTA